MNLIFKLYILVIGMSKTCAVSNLPGSISISNYDIVSILVHGSVLQLCSTEHYILFFVKILTRILRKTL